MMAAIAVALPLSACVAPSGPDPINLARVGCPADIRIATDNLPRVEWGFLYRMLNHNDVWVGDGAVRAPLMSYGQDTGVTLTVLTGDPLDGIPGNVALHNDDSLLLAAVPTDAAMLDARIRPTVGVFAPTTRDPQMLYWDAQVYSGVRTIQELGERRTPDATQLVPVLRRHADPFGDYLVGKGWLAPDQVVSDRLPTVETYLAERGIAAIEGDALLDPGLIEAATGSVPLIAAQLADDAGYPRDTLLAARTDTLVQYSDCLAKLVPIMQRSLVDYLREPLPTTELIADAAAQLGNPEYDMAAAAAAFSRMIDLQIVGNGPNDTIGDIDIGRLRALFDAAVPAWQAVSLRISNNLRPGDLVTNEFIDPNIRAD